MKISTKGRYGLRAMLDLACHHKEGVVALKDIADRQDISGKYLEQIFPLLKKSGLVKGVRGSQGGYILAMSPDKIKVGDILRALEGSLAPVDCVDENVKSSCNRLDTCATRLIWGKIKKMIDETLDSITLQDLVNEYEHLNEEQMMYYI